jgi:hypothetical protein
MRISLRCAGIAWFLGGVFVIGLQSGALGQDEDKSKTEKPEKPKKPALYDPKADARAQIDAATAKAKRQNARVLVMFGFEG